MRSGKIIALLLAVMVARPAFAFNLADNQPEPPGGGGDFGMRQQIPAEAINLAGNPPAKLTPEGRQAHNENIFAPDRLAPPRPGENGPRKGESGLLQPDRPDVVQHVPIDPSGDSKQTKSIVPGGMFISAIPFLPNINPAPDGMTRHQTSGRFTDFSPTTQVAIITKLKELSNSGDPAIAAHASETLGAIETGNAGNVFMERGVLDVSDQKGGPVIAQDLGKFGVLGQEPMANNAPQQLQGHGIQHLNDHAAAPQEAPQQNGQISTHEAPQVAVAPAPNGAPTQRNPMPSSTILNGAPVTLPERPGGVTETERNTAPQFSREFRVPRAVAQVPYMPVGQINVSPGATSALPPTEKAMVWQMHQGDMLIRIPPAATKAYEAGQPISLPLPANTMSSKPVTLIVQKDQQGMAVLRAVDPTLLRH